MIESEKKRFDALYDQHLRALKLQGLSASTIDVYSRAVRRLVAYFDCVPDQLSVEQLAEYFAELVDTRSWGTVRVDRNGLQFFSETRLEAGLALGRDHQTTAGAQSSRYPHRGRGRTAHCRRPHAALPDIHPDHLLNGAAPERDPGPAGG